MVGIGPFCELFLVATGTGFGADKLGRVRACDGRYSQYRAQNHDDGVKTTTSQMFYALLVLVSVACGSILLTAVDSTWLLTLATILTARQNSGERSPSRREADPEA